MQSTYKCFSSNVSTREYKATNQREKKNKHVDSAYYTIRSDTRLKYTLNKTSIHIIFLLETHSKFEHLDPQNVSFCILIFSFYLVC